MSLLDKASLVLIPSGTKNGTVFCQKPTGVWEDSTGDYDGQDGTGFNGQLDFTRASNATLVNSDGLIEKVRTNLLLQSSQFDTTWANVGTTETGGQTGYDGSSDAWLLEKNAISGRIQQSIVSTELQTYSVYAKAGTLNWILLSDNNGNGAYFDLSGSGAIGSTTSTITSAIQSIASGWFRCSVSANWNSFNFRIYPADGDNDTSGTSGSIYIQDAQLEAGDIATDYIPTTTSAVSVGPVSGSPRLDYLDSSYPRLLLEPQRTNLATYSEQFDNAAWSTSNVSIDSNVTTTTDPSGYNGSRLVTQGPSPSSGSFYRAFTFSATKYTYSIFAKMDEVPFLSIGEASSGSGYPRKSWFNIQNGTLGTIDAAHTAKIENYGNGWYRCSISFTATAGANSILNYLSDADYSGISTSNKGSYFWGAQLEEGSYPTSYIPTLSTSVTRIADACYKTGVSDVIGQTEGTIFVEAEFKSGYDSNNLLMTLSNTVFNSIYLNRKDGGLEAYIQNSGSTQMIYAGPVFTAGTHKLALAYKANDFAVYVDGTLVHSDTNGSVPSCNKLNLGTYYNESFPYNDGISQALVFKTRLTNSELATLTSL